MIILEKPYVSEFLIDTIVQHDWRVLDNKTIADAEIEEGALQVINSEVAKNYYMLQEFPLIYANSEDAITWVLDNLPLSNLAKYITTFKNKVAFRDLLKNMYPNFFYRAVSLEELKQIVAADIKFPVVVKPAVGFLSYGVHTVNTAAEWNNAIATIDREMKQVSTIYPKHVVDSSTFIIEELISGDEYAIDAYFDRNGDPVILNIFQHPFYNSTDVKDRIYLMSVGIMMTYMAKFGLLLREIGQTMNIRNFALHMEVRVKEDGQIIPIEINPMRFAGWCTTDVAKYAWGINVYECFYKQQQPNWNNILLNAKKDVFYFSMAEVPDGFNKSTYKGFDYGRFLSNYSNVLEVRRINPLNNPLFAVVFGSLTSKDEVIRILSLKTSNYIIS